MGLKFDRSTRLSIAIGISFSFFLVEIAIGFKTHSIALIADAFHYLNDLIGFIVALVAIVISERPNGKTHKDLTYGWQRAQLLGAFFNGVFLLALGLSIFLQSIERFISLQRLEDPKLVVIVGAIGLSLNIISMMFLHEHDHGHGHDHGDHHHAHPGDVPLTIPSDENIAPEESEIGSTVPMPNRNSEAEHSQHRHKHSAHDHKHSHMDYGMAGVLLHLAGDAFNNIGVIIAGIIVWKTNSPHRFYADPAVSLAIALMIILSSIPLVKRTGHILLQSPPTGIDVADIQHDLESIPGINGVHELHVWRLNQKKALASAHVVIDDPSLERFMEQVKTMNECFHAYGVHSATIQPELGPRRRRPAVADPSADSTLAGEAGDQADAAAEDTSSPTSECQMSCGSQCEKMSCCG